MQRQDGIGAAAAAIRTPAGEPADIAVILGSGLSALAARLDAALSLRYADIPGWPVSSVPGHENRLVAGTLAGRRVVVLSGRCHLYEGLDAQAVTFGVRVLRTLGVGTVVLTNASGGITDGLVPGTLMIVDDHLNLTGANPLIGPSATWPGPGFLDASELYSVRLRTVADEAAVALGQFVAHGVYAGVSGPSYETPAEIRYLRTIGADAVGMSTVVEAIAARQLDMEVLGVSLVCNFAAGAGPARKLRHADVLETARAGGEALATLVTEIVRRL
jgi:purine-nucleoside phosphorylase